MRFIISEGKYLVYEGDEIIISIIQEENGIQEELKVEKKIKISTKLNLYNSKFIIGFDNGNVVDFIYDGELYFNGNKLKESLSDYSDNELIVELELRGYKVTQWPS